MSEKNRRNEKQIISDEKKYVKKKVRCKNWPKEGVKNPDIDKENLDEEALETGSRPRSNLNPFHRLTVFSSPILGSG